MFGAQNLLSCEIRVTQAIYCSTLTIITAQITPGGPRHYSNGPVPFLVSLGASVHGPSTCPVGNVCTVDDHRVQQSLEGTVA
jgi:hypothetical protein